MNEVKLDLRKLLGFMIIADSASTMRLISPKIGGKGDPGIAQDLVPAVDPNVGHKLS